MPGGVILARYAWLVTMAAGLSAATAQSGGGGGGGGPPPQLVKVDTIRLEKVEQRREVTGEVRAVRRSSVASEEAGLVTALLVDVGDQVEKGRPLARLHDRLRALEVEQRQAEVMSRRAQVEEERARLDKARRDLRRLESLASKAGASQNEVDDAATGTREAEARLARTEADLSQAEAEERWASQRLADMEILAPFSGRVIAKGTEVGQWLREGDTVVELVALDEVDVVLDVPERFLGALTASGAEVELRLPALKESLRAGAFTIVAQGDRLARTFPVRVRLKNPDERLRPGMSAVGLAPTGTPMEALTAHKDAVMRNDAGSFVWFDAGGRAQVAPVELLFAVGDRVVVRSPTLKAGMRVLIEGNERVFPGQSIEVMGEEAAAAGSPGAVEGED